MAENMLKQLSDSCIKYAQMKGVSFTFKNKPLSHEEVFAAFGILPGVLKRANKICSVCVGTSLGGTFPKTDRSYLGYSLELKELSLPLPFAMLFIVDVLEAVIAGKGPASTVALDEFSYE